MRVSSLAAAALPALALGAPAPAKRAIESPELIKAYQEMNEKDLALGRVAVGIQSSPEELSAANLQAYAEVTEGLNNMTQVLDELYQRLDGSSMIKEESAADLSTSYHTLFNSHAVLVSWLEVKGQQLAAMHVLIPAAARDALTNALEAHESALATISNAVAMMVPRGWFAGFRKAVSDMEKAVDGVVGIYRGLAG